MKLSDKEWSEMVFRHSENADLTQTPVDLEASNVFWAIDGERSLGDIASEGNYIFSRLLEVVQRLVSRDLVEASSTKSRVVSKELMTYVSDRLSKEIGPMSDILIAETAEELGYEVSYFPTFKLPELVNRLALEIGDTEKSESLIKELMARIESDKLVDRT